MGNLPPAGSWEGNWGANQPYQSKGPEGNWSTNNKPPKKGGRGGCRNLIFWVIAILAVIICLANLASHSHF